MKRPNNKREYEKSEILKSQTVSTLSEWRLVATSRILHNDDGLTLGPCNCAIKKTTLLIEPSTEGSRGEDLLGKEEFGWER